MLKKLNRLKLRYLKKMTFLPQKVYLPYLYEYFTGKKLNLSDPKEFNQKIQWYKIYYRPKILNQLVDKYAVREYVEKIIGNQYLNEIYGVYDSYSEIDFEGLPNKFVMKAVHASSYNIICENKEKLDLKKVKRKIKKWLSTNQYYRAGQEWAYKDVKPRVIIEKYMEDDTRKSINDYKFYCFDGKVKFMEVHIDRAEKLKLENFDVNFNKLPFNKMPIENRINEPIYKPDNFEEMIELSEKLAKNFPFVRVDFYSIKGKSIFGEMTFYPSDGRKEYIPEEYNRIIGDYFILPEIPKGEKYIT